MNIYTMPHKAKTAHEVSEHYLYTYDQIKLERGTVVMVYRGMHANDYKVCGTVTASTKSIPLDDEYELIREGRSNSFVKRPIPSFTQQEVFDCYQQHKREIKRAAAEYRQSKVLNDIEF